MLRGVLVLHPLSTDWPPSRVLHGGTHSMFVSQTASLIFCKNLQALKSIWRSILGNDELVSGNSRFGKSTRYWAQTLILVGNPTKAETIVQRVKFPPHFKVPPHTHPYSEVFTVLNFTGQGGITFINPADDPRKK